MVRGVAVRGHFCHFQLNKCTKKQSHRGVQGCRGLASIKRRFQPAYYSFVPAIQIIILQFILCMPAHQDIHAQMHVVIESRMQCITTFHTHPCTYTPNKQAPRSQNTKAQKSSDRAGARCAASCSGGGRKYGTIFTPRNRT